MTITGEQVRDAALAVFRIGGVHYDQCGSRCHPDQYPHCVDCSGLTSFVLNELGLVEGCTGSFQQAREAHRVGGGFSIDAALNTPGCLLFQGINQGQGGVPGRDPGHVGISAGDGVHTLEARGHWAGVGVFFGRSLVWQWAGMMPGVTTGAAPMPPVDPSPLPPNVVLEDQTMTMLAMPPTNATPAGKGATARPIRGFNFVLLENGARLEGDVLVDPTGADRTRHWWAPPNLHDDPGIQLVDLADLRHGENGTPEHAIQVNYAKPNGAIQTYKAAIAVAS